MSAVWRAELDALQFDLEGGSGQCLVHRLAFRVLLAEVPTAKSCISYFHAHRGDFERAGAVKAERHALPTGARFHLTSRDILRADRS